MEYRYASLNDGDTFWEMRLGDFVIVWKCTYTNLDSIAYYTPRLYGTAYCS